MNKPEFPFQQMFQGMDWSKMQGMDWMKFQPTDMTKLFGEMKMPGLDMEGFMAAQKKNIEAVTTANRLAVEGFQAVAQRQAEILRSTMEELSKASQDLMSQGKPEDKMAKQADLAKEAFEKALANMREIAEMAAKANNEAADVINSRVSESIDEIKDLLSKAASR